VFVTNAPWDLCLDAPAPRCTALAEGFQIPDFKSGVRADLRRVIDARESHIEMHELMKSFKDHADIPTTFDGEIPEYAFGADAHRVLIRRALHGAGPRRRGSARPGDCRNSYGSGARRLLCVTFDDGRSAICTMPLSTEELAAWKRHPDTFFGIVGQRSTHANSALEFYDFFHESFRRESKERLLEVMANAPDFEQLRNLDQPQLASIHAERTSAALAVGASAGESHSADLRPDTV